MESFNEKNQDSTNSEINSDFQFGPEPSPGKQLQKKSTIKLTKSTEAKTDYLQLFMISTDTLRVNVKNSKGKWNFLIEKQAFFHKYCTYLLTFNNTGKNLAIF